MSPEQLLGHATTPASDLFAAGAIIFEMLSSRRAFAGRSAVEVFQAIQYGQPPTLTGSPAIAAVDRVIHRALAKEPQERHPSARAMAQELRAALLLEDSNVTPCARAMSRLIVLPFRVLRPEAKTDFLAFSLPDAITSIIEQRPTHRMIIPDTGIWREAGVLSGTLQLTRNLIDLDF